MSFILVVEHDLWRLRHDLCQQNSMIGFFFFGGGGGGGGGGMAFIHNVSTC